MWKLFLFNNPLKQNEKKQTTTTNNKRRRSNFLTLLKTKQIRYVTPHAKFDLMKNPFLTISPLLFGQSRQIKHVVVAVVESPIAFFFHWHFFSLSTEQELRVIVFYNIHHMVWMLPIRQLLSLLSICKKKFHLPTTRRRRRRRRRHRRHFYYYDFIEFRSGSVVIIIIFCSRDFFFFFGRLYGRAHGRSLEGIFLGSNILHTSYKVMAVLVVVVVVVVAIVK